jgi:hypothetical protein
MYLRCSVHDSPKKWKSWLSLAEIWYNTSFHTALGCSPFKALYGMDANSGISVPVNATVSPEVAAVISEREVQLSTLKGNLQRAQNRMKRYADRARAEREL